MYGITYRARLTLVRLAKILPFIICAMVAISYMETIYALTTNRLYCVDGDYVLYKPISWVIGRCFLYEWYTMVFVTILAFAMETCIYNKLCILYLCFNLWEKDFFLDVELLPFCVYIVSALNVILSTWIVYKGLKTYFYMKKG